MISDVQKTMEMGRISNLITDMTLRGATEDDLKRIIGYSMLLMDTEYGEVNRVINEFEDKFSELTQKYQSISQLRKDSSDAKNAARADQVTQAVGLKEKGYSNTAIAERMGLTESSVRALLKPDAARNQFPVIRGELGNWEKEILRGDNEENYALRAMDLVKQYIDNHYKSVGLEPPVYHLYTPWFSKSDVYWKATVSTTLPDGMYYEVSYSFLERRKILTAYKRLDTEIVYD